MSISSLLMGRSQVRQCLVLTFFLDYMLSVEWNSSQRWIESRILPWPKSLARSRNVCISLWVRVFRRHESWPWCRRANAAFPTWREHGPLKFVVGVNCFTNIRSTSVNRVDKELRKAGRPTHTKGGFYLSTSSLLWRIQNRSLWLFILSSYRDYLQSTSSGHRPFCFGAPLLDCLSRRSILSYWLQSYYAWSHKLCRARMIWWRRI